MSRAEPISTELQAALEAQVAAGAAGALARLEAPRLGLDWAGAAGHVARDGGRRLRRGDSFRVASVTKHVTAAVALRLAQEGRFELDRSLADQLAPAWLARWRALETLPRITPRQLLAHTSGLHDYFHDAAFAERLRADPLRPWRPAELVDHAAAHGRPHFAPGEGFRYSDTGYVIAGLLIEQVAGRPLHEAYRALGFDPLGMDATWLEGHDIARACVVAHHYSDDLDLTTVTPTIDWAGGGLVSTSADLTRFVRGLWSGRIVDPDTLKDLTRWTPGAAFPPGHVVSYEQYGLGTGRLVVSGVELIGHTGFIGAFAFYAPEYDAVMAGSHSASAVDRRPLVEALCRALKSAR
jgi:D-alanyl-D-alanine carboxypeptidase